MPFLLIKYDVRCRLFIDVSYQVKFSLPWELLYGVGAGKKKKKKIRVALSLARETHPWPSDDPKFQILLPSRFLLLRSGSELVCFHIPFLCFWSAPLISREEDSNLIGNIKWFLLSKIIIFFKNFLLFSKCFFMHQWYDDRIFFCRLLMWWVILTGFRLLTMLR